MPKDPIPAVERRAPTDEESANQDGKKGIGLSESEASRDPATSPPANTLTESGTDPGRGVALPGDRGPRDHAAQDQRPSFWRRIALGGRRHHDAPAATGTTAVPATRPNSRAAASTEPVGAEVRIVEPLLQALVSVEAKLERSHVDLLGRSDQLEQRLTQLWDIEEQLGSLGEVQESLLRVAEQQRRLETAIDAQTRTVRWLIGTVFVSLGVAAFVVALLLR